VNNLRIGDTVDVVSGPHEGRSGKVVQTRDLSLDGHDPETYAIVEYVQRNCFNEVDVDQISVPVRRLAPRR